MGSATGRWPQANFDRMIKDRSIDALVNECLIGPVLSMGATFIAYACALLAYLYLIFTSPAYNADGGYTPVVVAFAFVIGLQICKLAVVAVLAGGWALTCLRQNLHDAVEQWHRHGLRGHGMGPGGPYARASRSLPQHGGCVPTGPAGHPRLGRKHGPMQALPSASAQGVYEIIAVCNDAIPVRSDHDLCAALSLFFTMVVGYGGGPPWWLDVAWRRLRAGKRTDGSTWPWLQL